MRLADRTREYWCAAFFLRRATDRNRSVALTVLEHVIDTGDDKLSERADQLLKEIQNGTDQHSRRDTA